VYEGALVKREFGDDQLRLSGIVISDENDKRIFINFDEEHVAGLRRSVPEELSSALTVGKQVKVWVYRCSKVLFAHRIQVF
jgi:hypothetical protein